MDTREKIVPLNSLQPLLRNDDWIGVAGLFDPLTLAQAERIAAISQNEPERKILAVVEPGQQTLLTPEARAALMAGLREVHAVVIASPDQISAPGLRIDRDAEADRKRSAEFVQFVLARQQAGAAHGARS